MLLKRNLEERYVNYYNSDILAWEANIDDQYCFDPYACMTYMLAYITKYEREMSTVLLNISKETLCQN